MGTPHLTPEQREAILATYQQTLHTGKTAELLGLDIQRVCHYLKRQGVRLSGSQNGACYQNIPEVKQWAAEGVSFEEIGRRIGTTGSSVALFLKRNQIPFQPSNQKGERNPNWRGGVVIDDDGYVLLNMPDHHLADSHGYVREHRYVMEQKLGRRLDGLEVVHHKDEDKQNNHPDNLGLYPNNGEHLADTLKGKIPKWTEEGKRLMREANRRKRDPRKIPNPCV